jgi:hypothetical protein
MGRLHTPPPRRPPPLQHLTCTARQVRSCSLDTWLPEQVEFMARTGNALGNAHWEARLAQAGGKPASFATLQGGWEAEAGGVDPGGGRWGWGGA